ncbi:S41 family peptidase [Myxococcota bacterium]|nr:S41 family peptidase [Myxococcota bacterium]
MAHLPALILFLAWSATDPWAADLASYQATVDRVEESYLYLDRLDAALAFERAAEAAEEAVPWLLVEVDSDPAQVRALLAHGDTGAFATVDFAPADGLGGLPAALARLEDAIVARAASGGSAALPADLDLPVELLRGASRALDRHSVVLAGDRLDAFNERLRGRLVGIGCRIVRQDAGLVVRDIFPDGPADLAGLRSGDEVLRVDGVSTVGMDLDEAVERIKGERGTQITLVLRRVDPATGQATERVEVLVRDEVRIPNVEWERTAGGVGLIRIDHFSQQTTRLLEDALADLAEPPVAGLVLDLRGNSGGSMLQAAKVVDLFVDQGVILETGGRGFARVSGLVQRVQAWPAAAEAAVPALATQAPLVVLMDPDSASASEIVAGGLALLGRSVLLGQRSHGKGTVQQPFLVREAQDALGEVKLKLTIAEYRLAEQTPVVEGLGLRPDLSTERVELSRTGLRLPSAVTIGEALGLVMEDPGWREGPAPQDRGDLLVALGEQVVLATAGPSRGAALEAAAGVLASWREEEEARLADAFQARGIDWSPDDSCRAPCRAPDLDVKVELAAPARAGGTARVLARVHNRGPAPVHRVVVRLTANSWRLPWHGITIPVGFVPPGEEGAGAAVVELPVQSTARQDLVAVTVESDRRPAVGAQPVLLDLPGELPPPVAVEVRGVPPADTGEAEPGLLPVEVLVHNRGAAPVTGLQVRFLHPQELRLEPVEREALVPRLEPGASATSRLSFRWTGDAPPTVAVPVPLEVEVERHGELLRADVPVRWTGPVASLVPPRIKAEVPLSAPAGDLPVRVSVSDDQGVRSVTAWWGGDKLAWRSGGGRSLELDLDLGVVDGTEALVVDAVDLEGVTTRRRWYVRAMSEGDGMAQP